MSSSSSTISKLSLDLIEEILYRVPAKSLVRAKTTCKEWCALINDTKFIYEHLRRSQERFQGIDERVQVMDLVARTRSDSPIPEEFQPLSTVIIKVMAHCDGIMLCMYYHTESSFNKLALWNPLTRNIKLVEPRSTPTDSVFYDFFGIGYDNKNSPYDYKILRISCNAKAQMYECNSKSWRNLDDAKFNWDVRPGTNGVSVMGNMYWLAKKKPKNNIIGFDFSTETFKDICPCPCDAPRFAYDGNYLGGFKGDCLSLLEQKLGKTSPIEVWVSSKLSDVNDVSFTKYFSVDSHNLPFQSISFTVYCIAKHRRIIMWCGRTSSKSMTFYEIDEGGIRNQLVTQPHYKDGYMGFFVCGYAYIPSLVTLPV